MRINTCNRTTGQQVGKSWCVLRVERKRILKDKEYFMLYFVRISDAAKKTHKPIPYSVKDCGGNHREIQWGVKPPNILKKSSKS